MGFLDGLLGRKKPARPNLDALFAIPSAAITLQVSMDFMSTHPPLQKRIEQLARIASEMGQR